jgi:hypothetical protein
MWYPSKLQWFVIWAATLLCVIFWLATDPPPESFVMPGVLVAALFVWHVSADFRQTKD